MPITVNGVGTRYHGQRNAIVRTGVCRQCRRTATLTSYDTTHYVVVLFVPTIPLGEKRIMDSCSSCRRHYVLPIGEYHALRERDYSEARRLMGIAPPLEENAVAALRLINGYRDPAAISQAVAQIESQFPTSAAMHVFIAETHRYMGNYGAAEASTARSLSLQENFDVRESLAEFQFARGDVDAGRASLNPILESPTPRASRAMKMGIESLQRAGRHREALELMNRVPLEAAPPELGGQFTKLRTASERTLDRSVADPERYATDDSGMIVVKKRVPFQKTRWAVTAAAVLAVGYGAFSVYLGTSRSAFLINGLDKAYMAKVDGRTYVLQPHEIKTIRVGEGDISVGMVSAGFTSPPETYQYRSNFFLRPFNREVLALNPDGQAAIVTSVAVYSAGGGSPNEEEKLHTGEVGYTLDHADYPFENPPASVRMKSDDAAIRYSIIYADNGWTPARILSHLVFKKDAAAAKYAKRMLACPIDDADEALTAVALAGEDAAVASLKSRLGIRPVEIETHRLYQELTEQTAGDALRTEYTAMLDAEPTNASLQYLLARLLDDDHAALVLFQKAENANPSEPMAYVGEAYQCLARGQYAEALTLTRKARDAQPGRSRHLETEREILLAKGEYQLLLQALPTPHDNESAEVFDYRLIGLFCLNRFSEVDSMVDRRIASFQKTLEPAVAEPAIQRIRATLSYLRHDEKGFAAALQNVQDDESRFAAAISRRDLPAAEALEVSMGQPTSNDEMLLYIASECAGDPERCRQHLAKAIELLRARAGPEAKLGDWLEGLSEPTQQQMIDLQLPPQVKAIALASLAAARPSLRRTCYGLMLRYDYSPLYPHELLFQSRLKLWI